jgi:predicted RNA methylase
MIESSQPDDKPLAVIYTKQNSYILTMAAKVSLWWSLSDEPVAEQVLENSLEVSDSTELPVIENDGKNKDFDRAKFEKNLADFENQESKKVINLANDNDQPQSVIPSLVTQPVNQPKSETQIEKNEKIEEAGEDEQYVPVSSELMNKVASTAHKIASSLIDTKMVTQEDVMKVLQNKKLDFAELSNPQNMAYMMGYLQSFVWNLQGGNDKNNVKKLTKIIEVVRNLQGIK